MTEEEEAKECWAEARGEHDAFHLHHPEISCPWCHGEAPRWQDYMDEDREECQCDLCHKWFSRAEYAEHVFTCPEDPCHDVWVLTKDDDTELNS